MAELNNILATTAFPRVRYVHDCVDTGSDFPLLDGVEVLFPCDCAVRDYKVDGKNLWDSSNNLLKDAVDNGVMWSEFNMTVNAPINTEIAIRFYIPNTELGDIPVKTIIDRVARNNIDVPMHFETMLYNGTDSDAKTYGFKVAIQAIGGNATLKARSILSVTG